jgi:hypothetical protein
MSEGISRQVPFLDRLCERSLTFPEEVIRLRNSSQTRINAFPRDAREDRPSLSGIVDMAVDKAFDLLPRLLAQFHDVLLAHCRALLVSKLYSSRSFPWLQIIVSPHCTSPYNIDPTRTTDHLVLIPL